jgi:hypothetical protein
MESPMQAENNASPNYGITIPPGYRDWRLITVVRDATADYSDEMMHAALDINMPNYAGTVVSTDELVAAIAGL